MGGLGCCCCCFCCCGGGGSCIDYHSVSNLVILDENVNVRLINYVRTLSENLIDSAENIIHPFVFQHDNALAHKVRRTLAWLEQQDRSITQCPSQSPDLMIEQVWDFMERDR